jgi:uncharacterized protein (TIGR02246 family)
MTPHLERYSELARREILSARYEAGRYGSTRIESQHLLLGLMSEDWDLVYHFMGKRGSLQSIREIIESQTRIGERIPGATEISFSEECASILQYAEEEAIRRKDSRVDSQHLLLGILHAEGSEAARIFQEAISADFTTQRETGVETSEDEFEVRRMITDLINAWNARDAAKVSAFFDENGQFIDGRHELWMGRSDIERAVSSLDASLAPEWNRSKIRAVEFVDHATVVANIECDAENILHEPSQPKLSMTLILRRTQQEWRIMKANAGLIE